MSSLQCDRLRDMPRLLVPGWKAVNLPPLEPPDHDRGHLPQLHAYVVLLLVVMMQAPPSHALQHQACAPQL
jgi:hypothetical protein